MTHAIVIQRPAAATRLVLLFHGVGAGAADLVPLGEFIAPGLPQAVIVSVQAPQASDLGQGWQWFSVVGVTEASRPARVAQALPSFVQAVQHWQAQTGLAAAQTTLIGFSQGSIMALAATQGSADASTPLADQVIAIAGRAAPLPERAPALRAVHLLHGEADGVIPAQCSRDAAARLQALGAAVTLDLYPGLGHGIDRRVAARVAQLLAPAAAAQAGA